MEVGAEAAGEKGEALGVLGKRSEIPEEAASGRKEGRESPSRNDGRELKLELKSGLRAPMGFDSKGRVLSD